MYSLVEVINVQTVSLNIDLLKKINYNCVLGVNSERAEGHVRQLICQSAIAILTVHPIEPKKIHWSSGAVTTIFSWLNLPWDINKLTNYVQE